VPTRSPSSAPIRRTAAPDQGRVSVEVVSLRHRCMSRPGPRRGSAPTLNGDSGDHDDAGRQRLEAGFPPSCHHDLLCSRGRVRVSPCRGVRPFIGLICRHPPARDDVAGATPFYRGARLRPGPRRRPPRSTPGGGARRLRQATFIAGKADRTRCRRGFRHRRTARGDDPRRELVEVGSACEVPEVDRCATGLLTTTRPRMCGVVRHTGMRPHHVLVGGVDVPVVFFDRCNRR